MRELYNRIWNYLDTYGIHTIQDEEDFKEHLKLVITEMLEEFPNIFLPMGNKEQQLEFLLNERILRKYWIKKWLENDLP